MTVEEKITEALGAAIDRARDKNTTEELRTSIAFVAGYLHNYPEIQAKFDTLLDVTTQVDKQ